MWPPDPGQTCWIWKQFWFLAPAHCTSVQRWHNVPLRFSVDVVSSEGPAPEPLLSPVSERDVDDGSSLYASNSAPLFDDSQQSHQMPHASRRVQSAIPSGNKRRLLGRKVNAVYPTFNDEELKAQQETSGKGIPFPSRGKRQVTPAPEEFSMPRTESPGWYILCSLA